MALRKLRANTRVRLIVNGFQTYLRVKDIAQQEGWQAVEDFNREIEQGHAITGRLARYGKFDIQIDRAD